MTQKELFNIGTEFKRYLHRFADAGAELHPLLQLKVEHSERVAAIQTLAQRITALKSGVA